MTHDTYRVPFAYNLPLGALATHQSGAELYAHVSFVELGRRTHSRNQVKAFDNFCKSEPTFKRCYTGRNGRRFHFRFESAQNKNDFDNALKKMLAKLNYITQ